MSNKNIPKIFTLALSGICLGISVNGTKVQAASLTPDQIINTWKQGPEVNYGLLSDQKNPNWAVDNTKLKVPYEAITNFPKRIGQSSEKDTERYASLISDLVLTGDSIFSGSFMAPNDNDIIGLLWGYQDKDNHYRLSWGSGRVNRGTLGTGPYERPDLPSGQSYPNEIGSAGLTITAIVNGQKNFLYSDFKLRWERNQIYDFSINRSQNDLIISIKTSLGTIFSNVFTDNNFLSGKVGFNTAGVEVLYGKINLTNLTTDKIASSTAIPEPVTLIGTLTAIGFGTFFKQKKCSNLKSKK